MEEPVEKRKVFGVLAVLVGLSLLALAGQHWRAWQLGQVRGRQLAATERRYATATHEEQDRAVDAMELTLRAEDWTGVSRTYMAGVRLGLQEARAGR